jgi:hypothetical protein
VNRHKTCEVSSAEVRVALYHAGYREDGRPQNTITRFNRWWDELNRTDGNQDLLSELGGALDRLMEKHAVPASPAVQSEATAPMTTTTTHVAG